MQRHWIVCVGALVLSGAGFVACNDDDTVVLPADAGTDGSILADASTGDTGVGDSETTSDSSLVGDARADADAEAGASPPTRLLLSVNGSAESELAAFGLQSRSVDGRLVYPDYLGTTVITPSSPWLLEQSLDVVARLDPLQPWVVRSSWNVALDDAPDGGLSGSYSDPVGVVVGAGTKAYVLRYTRNLIAVIDTSADVDGGTPTKTIDLSGEVQAAGDGYVEMTAGWFNPQNNYVYVLLSNIDRNNVGCAGYCLLCSSTSPTVVAIDTATDQLVSLAGDAGAASGNGIVLPGFDPAFGPGAMVYDPPNNRLLVLQAGCNETDADGGAGPLVRREIDSVSLADGSTKMLLDLTANAYPSALYYVDQHHVVVQLDTAYMWDPSGSTLGPAIPNAPQAFALDGQGNLVGISQLYGSDGGVAGWSIASVAAPDGGITVLGTQDPFAVDAGQGGDPFANGYVSGAQLWPAP